MDKVMQVLFNTNHEQPSVLVFVVLVLIAIVVPSFTRYKMEQKHSQDPIPKTNPARSTPKKKKRKKR